MLISVLITKSYESGFKNASVSTPASIEIYNKPTKIELSTVHKYVIRC